MKTVFVDTNVILDVFLKREGFWQDSFEIFKLANLYWINAYFSASSMTDIFYIIKKRLSISKSREAVNKLLNLFQIVGVDGYDLRCALSIPINDLEDALQVRCAQKANADIIITNDINGFTGIDIPVMTPTEFIT